MTRLEEVLKRVDYDDVVAIVEAVADAIEREEERRWCDYSEPKGRLDDFVRNWDPWGGKDE